MKIAEVIGDLLLIRKMKSLEKKVRNKIGKKASTAGVKVIAKAIKSEIPSGQKSARKAIGFSVRKPRGAVITAKAGAGVGMKGKRRAKLIAEHKFNRSGKKKGVGISVANVAWLLAGTEKRYTGRRTRRSVVNGFNTLSIKPTGGKVKYTGRMKKSGYVQAAQAKSAGAAKQAVKDELRKGIAKEAGKV